MENNAASNHKRVTINFQVEPWLSEFIEKEKGIHRDDTKTETIHRLMKELLERREQPKSQSAPAAVSQPQQPDVPGFLRPGPYSNPIVQSYLKDRAKSKARNEAFEEREAIHTKALAERERIRTEERDKRKTDEYEREFQQWQAKQKERAANQPYRRTKIEGTQNGTYFCDDDWGQDY